MRIPLQGGSYVARAGIANCQRCINLYPEMNPAGAPVPFTLYPRPGFQALTSDPLNAAPVRGLYRASNGQGYACIGTTVYMVSANWQLTTIGTLQRDFSTPVSMIDNGTTLVLVDGSIFGYSMPLGQTTGFQKIVDGTGTFVGANWVDIIDGFIVFNMPGTNEWGSTHDNAVVFDQLYVAFKAGYPDPISALVVNRREIFLLGALKSEVWYDAGNPLFPFAELPGSYIEHGCAATYSVARNDINTYWLSQDLRGQGIVVRQQGYNTTRVSNHGVEFAISEMARTVGISDAIAYTYQQGGHVFYVLNFPAGNQTWVFDEAISDPNLAWHQRAWTDQNGNLQRDRGNCHAFLYGTNVVGDFANGTLYALDQHFNADKIGGQIIDISHIRTFPHIFSGLNLHQQPVADSNGHQMEFTCFRADMQVGLGAKAQVLLRVSRDRGVSFTDCPLLDAGKVGEYLTQPTWRTLGLARDMVFELVWSSRNPSALQGAWVDAKILNQ